MPRQPQSLMNRRSAMALLTSALITVPHGPATAAAAVSTAPALAQSLPTIRWRMPSSFPKALDTLLSQSTGNACTVSQAAAAAAMNGDQSFVTQSVAVYKQRRDQSIAALNAIPGISCRTPEGAFYLYVNCGGLIGKRTPEGAVIGSDLDVVMYLLESVGVAVVAGSAYGLSPYFRLSYATSNAEIEDACAVVGVGADGTAVAGVLLEDAPRLRGAEAGVLRHHGGDGMVA